MRRSHIPVAGLTAAVFVAGCSLLDGSRTGGTHHILSVTSTPLGACTTANITPVATIRVMIAASFDPAAQDRRVKFTPGPADDAHDDAAYHSGTDDAVLNDTSNHDLGLQTAGAKQGDWVRIKIVLEDKRYTFYQDGTFVAVGVGDAPPNNYSHLCYINQILSANADGNLVAVFYAQTQDSSTNPGHYNIGLLANGPGEPIFIDPKIINNG
jgi:hypothetical protein